MQRNTKIILGLAGAGVLAYLLWKNSKKTSSASPEVSSDKCQKRLGEFGVECNDGSCDVSNGVAMPCRGNAGGVKVSTIDLPYMIKDGAVVNGKKWTIKSQADCPAGYNFSSPPPVPCYGGGVGGGRNCDSGGPRCVKIEDQFSKRMCPKGQMPCPDDSGCFDPILDPISNWEAGKPHPCNRSIIKPKVLPEYGSGYATGY